MRPDDLFVLTPAFPADPGLAIAGCRAGARGTLDLEFVCELPRALELIERLATQTGQPFGVKLGPLGRVIVDELCARPVPRLAWVLLGGGCHSELDGWAERLGAAGYQVYVECVDRDEMRQAAGLGVAGLVLKGQEAAGRVGESTTFILLQQWLSELAGQYSPAPPVYAQGGIGLHTAAACAAAGAQGLVLDSQVLLARESPLDQPSRDWISNFDGSQTALFGPRPGQTLRVAHWPKSALGEALKAAARQVAEGLSDRDPTGAWYAAAAQAMSAPGPWQVRQLGQDAACAARWADRYCTVGGMIQAVLDSIDEHLGLAKRHKPIAAGSPLAVSHGTRYPLLQGPMTRVSDTAAFAQSVADAGGLPFLALALLRRAEVEPLLAETKQRLGERPWGAGILGFLPPEIRDEQTAAILEAKPPFVLIAGGRPDQARQFEQQGLATYLHVPSPALLRMFLKDGARRIILEGRECGGHVGPRTSFALWDSACEVILDHLGKNGSGNELHVVFAGGIHDDLSAAMVGAMAAPLAARGVRLGLLMGTAYLFTAEAVASGAIVERFQAEALGCQDTVLLETGPGHAIRCIPTPYCQDFDSEKRRLEQAGRSAEEITRSLEWLNVGRLRVASKGLDRVANSAGAAKLEAVSPEQQFARGMYMIGQVSTLRHGVTTMAELHSLVCNGGTERLSAEPSAGPVVLESEGPCDIAVIGVSCHYPGATDLNSFWANILHRVYSVTEIPSSHWDWSLYYDPDPMAKDKIVSKWGGFLPDIPFDPFQYGITPAAMKVIEPLQLLLLEAVRQALRDAGYERRPFARERTAAVCGIGGGGSPMATFYGFRACMPLVNGVPGLEAPTAQILETCDTLLPEWTEDSFPGFLMNVAVGRVANRFNLGGPNFAVDAACASSLAAVQLAIRELQAGTSDVALAMGADTVQTPFAYMAFSKTFALSRAGRCRPFDAAADGIVLSEGIGVVVLKRLADAERDGDRVLAVIRGVGSSSDGRDKGLTAPNAAGQTRALERAYRQAGLSPARVGLIEAHGTGTVVGDRTEAQSLGNFLRASQAEPDSCAMGSVKSLIGHSKCAAGLAGLIKTTLALHHKVLPPTLVEKPNPNAGFEGGPLYLNTEARPWIHGSSEPRCAGVSAFGFGGTNFHIVLEEYTRDYVERQPPALRDWDCELVVVRRPGRPELVAALQQIQKGLSGGGRHRLADLAASAWRGSTSDPAHPTVAIVAASLDDLREKLLPAISAARGAAESLTDPRGVYFAAERPRADSRLALLFPGQGSQYPNMLAELALAFPVVRQELDRAEGHLRELLPRRLGRLMYPPSTFDDESARAQAMQLARAEYAQPALAAAELAMLALMDQFGVAPAWLAGHSFGEYVALAAAGSLTQADLLSLAHRRGELLAQASDGEAGGMLAVVAGADRVADALRGLSGITLANLNSPTQTVISGSESALEQAGPRLSAAGLKSQRLSVACAFHSPLVAGASARLADELAGRSWDTPRVPVFSNRTGQLYPAEGKAVCAELAQHLTSPVRFTDEIEALYQAGARTFVEVGPQGVLTGLVRQILDGRPHLALATDVKGRSGIAQLAQTLAQLLMQGVDVRVQAWFDGRTQTRFHLADLEQQSTEPPLSASTWIINGVRARPHTAPDPLLLGQRLSPGQVSVAPVETSGPEVHGVPVPPSVAAEAGGAAPVSQSSPRGAAASHWDEPPPAASPYFEHGSSAVIRTSTPHALSEVGDGIDDATLVMCRYQDLMAQFLQSQQSALRDFFQTIRGEPLADGNGRASSAALPTQWVAPPAEHSPAGQAQATASTSEPAVAAEPRNGSAHPAVAELASPAGAALVPASPAAPAAVTRDELSRRLLDLVSKRTGYPQEMLAVDLDLEADLGVDSIKRVEILGTLAESLGGTESQLGSKLELEKLTGLRTLEAILDYLDQTVIQAANAKESDAPAGGNGRAAPPRLPSPDAIEAPESRAQGAPGAELEVQRAVVELVEAPVPSGSRLLIPAGAVLITLDGRGIALGLGQRLADFGQRVIYLYTDGRQLEPGLDDVYSADACQPEQVEQLAERIHAEVGQLGGIVHLAGLGSDDGPSLPAAEAAWRDVHSLYLLARTFADDLQGAAEQGGALLLAGMSLGGQLGFASRSANGHYRAGHGGMAGFLKCVAQEWDGVVVRAVDMDLTLEADDLADLVLAELRDPQGPTEVGVTAHGRVTWRPVPAPLPEIEPGNWPLAPGARVLITGGARGITARVARALAAQSQPHLILVGRTPLPAGEEPAELARLSDPGELKRALIERMRVAGQPALPAAVEAEFRRLMVEREVRGTLAELTELGSTWEYHAVDVRDREQFGALLDELNHSGPIEGLIHGAGVIEDRLLRDKTPESFARVWRTKVDSAFTLAEKLNPSALKFAIFFASLASRYGNRGQSDYAAANEVLSKLAIELGRRWPARVCSVAWGPWSGVGMVAELEPHLTRRGLKLIDPETGPQFVLAEIAAGRQGASEVIVAGGAEHLVRPRAAAVQQPSAIG